MSTQQRTVVEFERLAGDLSRLLHRVKGELFALSTHLQVHEPESSAIESLMTLGHSLDTVSRLMPSPPVCQPCPLPTTLHEVLAGYTGALEQRGFSISEQLSNEECYAESNATVLGEILCELLDNAAHASPKGATIIVSSEVSESSWRLTVTDEGHGVVDNVRDNFFDPFVSSARERWGVGLAAAHYRALMLGGELEYKPNDPTGSTFSAVFPRKVVS